MHNDTADVLLVLLKNVYICLVISLSKKIQIYRKWLVLRGIVIQIVYKFEKRHLCLSVLLAKHCLLLPFGSNMVN